MDERQIQFKLVCVDYSRRERQKKKVPWTDWIPKTSILLFDFELTKTMRLRKATVEHLKNIYSELHH